VPEGPKIEEASSPVDKNVVPYTPWAIKTLRCFAAIASRLQRSNALCSALSR